MSRKLGGFWIAAAIPLAGCGGGTDVNDGEKGVQVRVPGVEVTTGANGTTEVETPGVKVKVEPDGEVEVTASETKNDDLPAARGEPTPAQPETEATPGSLEAEPDSATDPVDEQ